MPSAYYNTGLGTQTDWDTNNIDAMLVNPDFVHNKDHDQVSDFVSAEIAGTGYVRKDLTATETIDNGTDTVKQDAGDLTWTGANFTRRVKGLVAFKNLGSDSTNVPLIYNELPSGAIQAVNTGTKTFTLTGDLTSELQTGGTCVIEGSTGNDGEYDITNVAANGANTDVTVSQTVPSATADGRLIKTIETNGGDLTINFATAGLGVISHG